MFLNNIVEIQGKMNVCGKEKKPFLFAVNFEMTEGFIIDDPLSQNKILFKVLDKQNSRFTDKRPDNIQFKFDPIVYEKYKQKFEIVHNGLKRGYSYLTNLTVKTPITTNLSLAEIFSYSNAPYKLLLPGKFVCFSPERFVKISGDIISTNPMKGTIDASIPNAEQIILNDYKETAEHNTIVDLLRNDLSIISDNVKVDRFRYIDRIKTNQKSILQVSSEITGKLQPKIKDNLGDIIFGMLPAGSISGAPKSATLDIIRQAEGEPRGYYTGIFGYYDSETLDSAVMIRYIEQINNRYYFRSGGGITVYSDCKSEYEEVFSKVYLPII
ncbi:aminodeoxychorismate synthase component I [Dysgonomonas sp. Marseille-P4677]|uniref:aminodeoxychorismate synthase component I n=1 Tax=Dysgonomonas sp. Marseille-P4677 TaxID=2364790 RepID=UPI001F3F962A|nr:aminodeoxychorismate synthase component I [Dysgonomonas sp. Marseille-P4677]